MNRTRNILRVVSTCLAVMLLIYINKSSADSMSVVEFKYKTFKKIEADSLNAKRRLDLLVNETTQFIDSSDRVRIGIRYLTLLFVLQLTIELVFVVLSKTNIKRQH
jgi:hypothetical protein